MNEVVNISPYRRSQFYFKGAKIEALDQSPFGQLSIFPMRKKQAPNQVFFLENQSIESAWILSLPKQLQYGS